MNLVTVFTSSSLIAKMARSKKTSLAARRGPEVLLDIDSQVDNANDKPDIRRLAAQVFLSSIRVTSPATLPPGKMQ